MHEDGGLEEVGERIEALLEGLRSSTEPSTWVRVEELVRLVTELYGAGLARIVAQADDGLLAALAADDLVGGLLVLHDLHPEPLTARVVAALDAAAPTLREGGVEAELVSVDPDTGEVALLVRGGGGGCGSTDEAVRSLVRDAVTAAVPDVTAVAVRLELAPPATPVRLGRKPLTAVPGR